MFIKAPGEGVSTCRCKGQNGDLTKRTYDYVIASHRFQGKIKNMDVVEDFESRPHKAVTLLAARDKEFQMCREQKMPKAIPGFNGGKLPGRSNVEGRKEEEREEEGQEKKMENEVIRGIIAGVSKKADAVGSGVTRNAVPVAQSIETGEDLFS